MATEKDMAFTGAPFNPRMIAGSDLYDREILNGEETRRINEAVSQILTPDKCLLSFFQKRDIYMTESRYIDTNYPIFDDSSKRKTDYERARQKYEEAYRSYKDETADPIRKEQLRVLWEKAEINLGCCWALTQSPFQNTLRIVYNDAIVIDNIRDYACNNGFREEEVMIYCILSLISSLWLCKNGYINLTSIDFMGRALSSKMSLEMIESYCNGKLPKQFISMDNAKKFFNGLGDAYKAGLYLWENGLCDPSSFANQENKYKLTSKSRYNHLVKKLICTTQGMVKLQPTDIENLYNECVVSTPMVFDFDQYDPNYNFSGKILLNFSIDNQRCCSSRRDWKSFYMLVFDYLIGNGCLTSQDVSNLQSRFANRNSYWENLSHKNVNVFTKLETNELVKTIFDALCLCVQHKPQITIEYI